MYMQSGSDFNCGVMRGCGLTPSLSKRDEGSSPNLALNTYPSYLSQLDSWGDPKAAYRLEQPVGRPLSSCSYPPSVKEENVCCMYSAEKRAKSRPEAALYPHPLPESCLGEHEVPVPSYYRASPSYSALDKPPHCAGTNDFDAPFEQRAGLHPRAEPLESPQLGGKVSFPETPKSDSQTPSPSEIKTEQSLAGSKGSPLESEKERAHAADSSPDTSENEAKGKAARLGRGPAGRRARGFGLPARGREGREKVGPRRPGDGPGDKTPAGDPRLRGARREARPGLRKVSGPVEVPARGGPGRPPRRGLARPAERLQLPGAGGHSRACAGSGVLAPRRCPGGGRCPPLRSEARQELKMAILGQGRRKAGEEGHVAWLCFPSWKLFPVKRGFAVGACGWGSCGFWPGPGPRAAGLERKRWRRKAARRVPPSPPTP